MGEEEPQQLSQGRPSPRLHVGPSLFSFILYTQFTGMDMFLVEFLKTAFTISHKLQRYIPNTILDESRYKRIILEKENKQVKTVKL